MKKLGVFKDFSDNSLKSVFDIGENKIIEMTLLFNKEKTDVVCVPTHHFCNLGCKMCHLTNNKLNKKMLPITIEYFLDALIQTLTEKGKRRTKKSKLLISFMGVGEPLLNIELLENVFIKENYIKKILGYQEISYALSTMMPNENIKKIGDIVEKLNVPLKIHFSLHTPIEKNRRELIPSTKVTIDKAFEYLNDYRNKIQMNSEIIKKYVSFHRTNDPVEIHYTLINNLNDGEKELKKLCSKLKIYNIPIKFIRFNPINELEISPNESKWIKKISKECPNLRIKTYTPPGREIGSSCGEFTKHYYHEEIETEEENKEFDLFRKKHQIE